jgi:hypothetical protein
MLYESTANTLESFFYDIMNDMQFPENQYTK